MALEVIGAGLGRTGTLSLKAALERLGFGPCYHMMEILSAPERARHWIGRGPDATPEWDTVFDGYRSTVDWPAAAYWRELRARHPDAKVLLSLRDADRWHESMMKTIYASISRTPSGNAPEVMRRFHEMVRRLILEQTFDGRLDDAAYAKRIFHEHNQAVIDAVPAQRLLVHRPGDGWEPLCRFLGVPVPDEGFPRLNDTAMFRERAGLEAID